MAEAADGDGTIAKVEFYQGSVYAHRKLIILYS
jgi:hypothetical protein